MKKIARGVADSLRKLVKNAFPKLDIWTLRQAPSGHLQCSGCGKPYWAINNSDNKLSVECQKCALDTSIDINHIAFDEYLLKGDFQCPKCQSKSWVIQIAQPYLCIGCKKCAYQTVASLQETPNLYLPQ